MWLVGNIVVFFLFVVLLVFSSDTFLQREYRIYTLRERYPYILPAFVHNTWDNFITG